MSTNPQIAVKEAIKSVLVTTDDMVTDYLSSVILELLETNKNSVTTPKLLQDEIGEILLGYGEVEDEEQTQQTCNKIYQALTHHQVLKKDKTITMNDAITERTPKKLSAPVLIGGEAVLKNKTELRTGEDSKNVNQIVGEEEDREEDREDGEEEEKNDNGSNDGNANIAKTVKKVYVYTSIYLHFVFQHAFTRCHL